MAGRTTLKSFDGDKGSKDVGIIGQDEKGSPTYYQLKQSSTDYQNAKRVFLSEPPFNDWLVSPRHLQDFSLSWNQI